MSARLAVLPWLLLVAGVAFAGPEASHAETVKTKRFTIHARPGSRAAADLDRQAVAAERDLDRVAEALKTTPKGPFHLWVYDDVSELQEATGTRGNGGFSLDDASHVPFDNDQTRLHELVHVVAYEWPKSGPETRNLFYAEGLANAVLEFVDGVHVHAVAAHYKRAGKLPPLAEMTDAADFYAWLRARPGFNAYDVAASWMRHLLDAFGPEKVRRFYTGTSAKAAFGSDVGALEKAWLAKLDAYKLRPEVEILLKRRAGEAVAFRPFSEGVPAAVLGEPADWVSLLSGEAKGAHPERWKKDGATLVAKNDADDWEACDLGKDPVNDVAVRVKVVTTGYTPLQVRFGNENQVLFVQPGTFFFRGSQGLASDPAVQLPLGASTAEIVVARRGKRIQAWFNGRKALEVDLCAEGPLPVGVGIHKGSATFQEVSLRRLP